MNNKQRLLISSITFKLNSILICASMFLAGEQAWAINYNVTSLATLEQGSASVVRGPNGAGTSVGGGKALGGGAKGRERQGLVFANGGLQRINGLSGSDYTVVFGINDVGGLVGASNTATAVRAFVNTQAGGSRELSPLAGDTASSAFAVNNHDQVVGFSSGPSGERAVVWGSNSTVRALAGAPGVTGRAMAINQRGDIVGVVDNGAGRRGMLWPGGGAAQELSMLAGYTTSEAASVNARGDAVGYSANPIGARRATLWPSGGGVVNLGTLPGGNFSQASGSNDVGVVVGISTSSSGSRAFIWTAATGMQDINSLIAPSPFVLTQAIGINNAGMIVAIGHDTGAASPDGHEDHELPTKVFLLIRSGV